MCLVARTDGRYGVPDPFTDAWGNILDVETEFVLFVLHSRKAEELIIQLTF